MYFEWGRNSFITLHKTVKSSTLWLNADLFRVIVSISIKNPQTSTWTAMLMGLGQLHTNCIMCAFLIIMVTEGHKYSIDQASFMKINTRFTHMEYCFPKS